MLRAGWGISYSAGDSWAYLNGGYSLNGLGYNTVQASAPSFGLVSSQLQNGIVYSPSQLTYAKPESGREYHGGPVEYLFERLGRIVYDPSAGRPARINQWNVALQRQLSKNMSIEAAYVGNRGVWEPSNGLVSLNAITPARLEGAQPRSHQRDYQNADDVADLLRCREGGGHSRSPTRLSRTTAPWRRACGRSPSTTARCRRSSSNQGNSFYDSLQVKFVKRLSHGLDVSSNYTFSKTENIGGYINADPYNRAIQKGLDSNDYPHIFVTAITYMTPKATSNKLIRAVTGDWTWGATLRYASGGLIAAPQSQVSKWSTYTFESGTPMIRVPGSAAVPDESSIAAASIPTTSTSGSSTRRPGRMCLPEPSAPAPATTTITADPIRSTKT